MHLLLENICVKGYDQLVHPTQLISNIAILQANYQGLQLLQPEVSVNSNLDNSKSDSSKYPLDSNTLWGALQKGEFLNCFNHYPSKHTCMLYILYEKRFL